MTPRRALSQNIGAERRSWIGQLAQAAGDPQIQRRTRASQAEFTKQLQQAMVGLRFGEGRNLGIIDEDEYGLYMAQVQTLTYLGNNMTIAGVYAVTLVNEKMLSYYLFDVYEEPATIIRLHDMVKAHLRRFIVENE